MLIEQIVFYVFAITAVGAGLLVITLRNPVSSALYLVLAFFASSVLWILLEAEFLALVLVFVYVGAVMTLFLFVVMMLNLNTQFLKGGFVKFLPIAGLIVAAMVAIMFFVIAPQHFAMTEVTPHGADYSNIKDLGMVLYTEYAYPFEIAAVILLVAIIAAIGLCFVEKRKRKMQDVPRQIQVRRDEEVKLVKMPSERKL